MSGDDHSNLSILITGGGAGIGAATAELFVSKGARVTIAEVREDKAREVGHRLGVGCRTVVGDVRNAADRERFIDAAVEHGQGLDVLINNAGNLYKSSVENLEESALLEIFHVNVVAGMMLLRCAVPHLEKRSGSVVFVSSIHTRRLFPESAPYLATKSAVNALTRSFAAELGAKGIRVNCVLPGSVQTDIIVRSAGGNAASAEARAAMAVTYQAITRKGEAEDIAKAIEYLVVAPFVTGALLDVDGGMGLGLTGSPPRATT